jgi:peptidoglycan hydrolase-like protein with peptidoglycan-binding domain
MKLKVPRKHLVGWLVLIVAGVCFAPPRVAAESAKESSKTTSKKVAKRVVRHSKTRRRYSRRRSSYRYRLSRLRPKPNRIEEIQQALIREGFLKQEPTGKWDEATRAAMRNYQQANGFNVTGLPEAKPLMKLGLGPHPLPNDVDPTLVGSAQVNSSAKPDPSSSAATESPAPGGRQ